MKLLVNNNDELRRYIANVVHEVDNEDDLFNKIEPYILEAQTWMAQNIVDDFAILNDAEIALAKMIIVSRAFFFAIPALDLVVTPNGFGVVNTNNIAPASKERVERLRLAQQAQFDSLASDLLIALHQNSDWAKSPAATRWRRSFLYAPRCVASIKKDGETDWEAFDRLLPLAVSFESEAARLFIGRAMMERFRNAAPNAEKRNSDNFCFFAALIMSAELNWIRLKQNMPVTACPNEHELWHLVGPIVDDFSLVPELYNIWRSEMGDIFDIRMSEILPSKTGGSWL